MHRRYLISILLAISCLTGCSSTAVNNEQNPDPYENFNRDTYRLNDQLDKAVLKPTATVYLHIVPYYVRQGVGNFFSNVSEVSTIGNDLLQGRFYWFMNDSWRFIINTTVGIGGIFDVAKKIGLAPHDNNFGLTLTRWGAQPAPYLMMPVLGPATLVEINGMPVDYYLSPWSYTNVWVGSSLFIVKGINTRANLLQNENLINQVSLDPYLFVRSAYLQYRGHLVWINDHPPIAGSASAQDEIDTGE